MRYSVTDNDRASGRSRKGAWIEMVNMKVLSWRVSNGRSRKGAWIEIMP